MSRVQVLKAAGSATTVKFLEMTRIHSKSPNTIVCIFEGEDEKYYGCRLSTSFGNSGWHGINTGGRKSVLDLRDSILQHPVYRKCKFLCFIDRDYEDWLVNPDPDRIYITPCYSIENLYANEVCLSGLLSAEFRVTNFNEFSPEHAKCIEIFNTRMNEAAAHALEFNAWAKSRSIMARDKKPPIRIFLNDVSADDLVEINLIECKIKYDSTNISSIFKKLDNTMLDQSALTEARNSFAAGGCLEKFRGKQQVEIFKKFLKSLKNDFTQPGNIVFKTKNRLKIDLDNDKIDILSELSQYAKTPDCLRTFLRRNMVGYGEKL
jgi:hypothetical protein